MDLTTQINRVLQLANQFGYPDAADWISRSFFPELYAPKSSTGNRASKISDLIEPLQIHALNEIAKRKKIDLVIECVAFMDCLPGELSKAAARIFREHLESIGKDQNASHTTEDKQTTQAS